MPLKTSRGATATGRRIRSLRAALGITQADAARRAGTTRQAWHQWERGAHEPGARALRGMMRVLGCSADDILTGARR